MSAGIHSPLSEEEAIRRIERFESEHDVLAITMEGMPLWQLLRFSASVRLMNPSLGGPRGLSKARRIVRFLGRLPRVLWLVARPGEVRYIVKSNSSDLRHEEDGRFLDIYFDDLLRQVSGGIKFQSSNSSVFLDRERRALLPVALDLDVVNMIAAAAGRAESLFCRSGKFAALSDRIGRHLGLEGYSPRLIKMEWFYFRWRSRIFEMVLRRMRPKAVLESDNGDHALVAACKKLGIRFIVLQHGILTEHHGGMFPARYRYNVPGLLLPDVLAVTGDYWKERQAGNAIGESNIVPVGSGMIERYRRQRGEGRRRAESSIVVTTQGVDRERLLAFMGIVLRHAKSRFTLTIKLHPAYDCDKRPYLDALGSDDRVRIVGGHENPNTYALLAAGDLHVSISSTCHYDALALGVQTVVLPLMSHELVRPLLDSNLAVLASSPEKLARMIDAREWMETGEETPEYFCRSGYIGNLAALMARL